MLAKPPPRIHLPKVWQGCVKSARLHTITLVYVPIQKSGYLPRSRCKGGLPLNAVPMIP